MNPYEAMNTAIKAMNEMIAHVAAKDAEIEELKAQLASEAGDLDNPEPVTVAEDEDETYVRHNFRGAIDTNAMYMAEGVGYSGLALANEIEAGLFKRIDLDSECFLRPNGDIYIIDEVTRNMREEPLFTCRQATP